MQQLLWKMVWQFLKWSNTELQYDPATPLGYVLKRSENNVTQTLAHNI